MESSKRKLIAYYSNYGLEQSQLLHQVDPLMHDARIRAMMLLVDAVKIPLSHMLRMPRQQQEQMLASNEELIANGLFRIELTDEYPDPSSYADAFQRREFGGRSDAMSMLKQFEGRGLQVSMVHASRRRQVGAYRQLVTAGIETGHLAGSCSDIETGVLLDIVASTPTKEEFDTLSQRFVTNPRMRQSVVELSNVVYFIVGSLSEGNVATSNTFLTSNKALAIQSIARDLWTDGDGGRLAKQLATPHMPATSELYDPDAFLLFLIAIEAIRSESDIALLTYDDLHAIRNDSGYRQFVKSYKRLVRQSATLADLCARYDVEWRWRRMGLATVTLIMFGAYLCATHGNELGVEGDLRTVLEAASRVVELAGFYELHRGAAKRLQYSTQANRAAKVIDDILRETTASMVPLSYAADLIGTAVQQHR